MAQLTPELLEMMVLTRYDGGSYKMLAEVFGVAEGNVGATLARQRKRRPRRSPWRRDRNERHLRR